MKFNLWFICITFPLMFLWMLNIGIAAALTMFLLGIVNGIRWLNARIRGKAAVRRALDPASGLTAASSRAPQRLS